MKCFVDIQRNVVTVFDIERREARDFPIHSLLKNKKEQYLSNKRAYECFTLAKKYIEENPQLLI